MANAVTAVPALASAEAADYFASTFARETDCWDVHEALGSGDPGFVLLDVRGPEAFAKGHVPGAVHLPHGKIIASRMKQFADAPLFVTYCAGPHCNGAARAALRLAQLGLPVKTMPGGVTGWIDEGFALESATGTAAA